MSSSPLEEVLKLANAKFPKIAESDMKSEVKFPDAAVPEEPTNSDGADGSGDLAEDLPDNVKVPHGEWQDNEDMHGMGISMSPHGDVHHGAMKIGKVISSPKGGKKRYVGMHHPSGALTEGHVNRAKAAMALAHLHHYMPHTDSNATPVPAPVAAQFSNSELDTVLELAAKNKASEFTKKGIRSPEEGQKLYGDVEYGDPKNKKYPLDPKHIHAALDYIDHEDSKSKYPLNGVTWDSVKARIVAAAKKQGVKVSG